MSKITSTKKLRQQTTLTKRDGRHLCDSLLRMFRVVGYSPAEKRTYVTNPNCKEQVRFVAKGQIINWSKL